MRRPTPSGTVLALALLAIALLYATWFRDDPQRIAAWLVLAMPPLLLAPGALLGGRLSRFWAGVLALFWFSHGVMEAWSETATRMHGLTLLALALLVVFTVAWPALAARRQRRGPRRTG